MPQLKKILNKMMDGAKAGVVNAVWLAGGVNFIPNKTIEKSEFLKR